jgi:single-strand DNA-binding protein
MSINRVILSGNLTRDPELRETAGGTPVLKFGLAVNEKRKNASSGEWEDYANFVECTLFGNRANALNDILVCGAKIACEGRLRYSSWEKDGQKRSKLEVIVDDVELMTRNDGNNDNANMSNEDIDF